MSKSWNETIRAVLKEVQVEQVFDERYEITDESLESTVSAINAAVREHKEAEIVDEYVAHVLENIYPLDVFPRDIKGDTQQQHVAGIYHGLHILRREVRGLSAREDLDFLPQETEEYYQAKRSES